MEKYIIQKKSKCLKVVLYGPESSGKTTLAIQLAKYYKTKYVPEFARQFLQNKWDNPIAWIDTVTTSLFFAGMWLMAKRKLEHWVFWIIGDIISVPLYLYKGLMLTSFQYLIFTILAIKGYKEWRNILFKKNQNV